MIEVFHIALAMKPCEGGFADNALEHGVSGLNIDGCRVLTGEQPKSCLAPGFDAINKTNAEAGYRPGDYHQGEAHYVPSAQGRWPANVIHDGCDGVLSEFPETGSNARQSKANGKTSIWGSGSSAPTSCPDDEGSAARFFFEVTDFEEE